MAMEKELLLKGLLDEHGEGRKLIEDELAQVFDRWAKLGSRSLRNLIVEAQRFCAQGGYTDSILKLKKSSTYDYIHHS
jgi:hemerythrin-like domain-containing protein